MDGVEHDAADEVVPSTYNERVEVAANQHRDNRLRWRVSALHRVSQGVGGLGWHYRGELVLGVCLRSQPQLRMGGQAGDPVGEPVGISVGVWEVQVGEQVTDLLCGWGGEVAGGQYAHRGHHPVPHTVGDSAVVGVAGRHFTPDRVDVVC